MRLLLVLIALLGCAGGAFAHASTDKQSDGRFTAIALVTSDTEWHQLFQRPETPQIDGEDRFGPGDRGAVALVFSNAEPRGGMIRIECDITAFDPEGSKTILEAGLCYDGPFAGDNILHPTMLDLQFEIGPDDPAGRAGFEIAVRDAHSGHHVELNVAFTQDTAP